MTKVLFKDHLDQVSIDPQLSFLIYDSSLLKHSREFKIWQKKFKFQYPVQAGENLKALSRLNIHLGEILRRTQTMNTRDMQIVVIGGGSVGDFGGFVASIFKRGVGLVHIPSTWLAAIDSAHGGKTALNVDKIKNQIGTFYPAQKVWIIKALLRSQDPEREIEACGELIKMALISGGTWAKKLLLVESPREALERNLKHAIKAKYKIVKSDPYEKNGKRQILNLGHTWGHVLETALALPHGIAVQLGLRFCLEWSYHKKLLSLKQLRECESYFEILPEISAKQLQLSLATDLLLKDKKKNSSSALNFIFLRGLGRPIRLRVKTIDILNEANRQGWLKP